MKRFIEGEDRGQSTLFPERLDDWIIEDNPVRVIDVFDDEGLPNTRPIALNDSPRCQRSHDSVFSAVLNPRPYPCFIRGHSIFAVKIKCCVDQLRPPR